MKKLVAAAVILGVAIGIWQFGRQNSPAPAAIAEAPPPAKAPAPTPKTPPAAPPETRVAENQPSISPPAEARLTPAPVTPTPTPQPAVVMQAAPPSARRTEKMPLAEMLLPNQGFSDPKFALTATYPEGWSVRDAIRWGLNARENTVFFDPEEGSRAVPSMYYQAYNENTNMGADGPEAFLRRQAAAKEAQRRSGAADSDYTNDPDSFVYREINGKPTLSYFATATRNGEVHAEYFTRILGSQGYVMFFTSGPVKDVQNAIPKVSGMASSVRIP